MRALDRQFPSLPYLLLFCAGLQVHDPNVCGGEGNTNAARLAFTFNWVHVGHGRRLGEAEALQDYAAGQLFKAVHDLHRQGSGAADHVVDGGEIVFRNLGVIDYGGEYGWNQNRNGRLRLGDGLEKIFDFELRYQGHGAAHANRPVHDRSHPKDVEYGNHTEETLMAASYIRQPTSNLSHVDRQITVSEHHPLCNPGGATGILEQGHFSHIHFRSGWIARAVLHQSFERVDGTGVGNLHIKVLLLSLERIEQIERKGEVIPDTSDNEVLHLGLFPDLVDPWKQMIQAHQHFDPSIIELMDHLPFHIHRIGHYRHATDTESGIIGDDGLRTIGKHDGDPVAGLDPQLTERGSKPADLISQLLVGESCPYELGGCNLRKVSSCFL